MMHQISLSRQLKIMIIWGSVEINKCNLVQPALATLYLTVVRPIKQL